MRKVVLLAAVCVVALAACSSSSGTAKPSAANGGGGATPTAGGGGGDNNWSGNGSAQVTLGGTAATVSPGGCYVSSAGTDFRFGSWENPASADWIIGVIYSAGGKAPVISGGVGGKLFVLGGATGTVGSDGKGTFSGTDSAGGNGTISGTFSCK